MKNQITTLLRAATMGALLFTLSPLEAFQEPQKTPEPDNTRTNKRDRTSGSKTADSASQAMPDREIMQKIRKAVVADDTLSTYAHNVKIVAKHGKVTLKGPVRSEEEKKNIEAKAAEVAGAENVTNQLSVAPDKSK